MSISKRGLETLVNTYTDDMQGNASIAANGSNGGYQIVWESEGQDGDGLGVFGQNFKKNGSKDGAELMLNQLTIGDQRNPDVAFNEDGNGAWVWQTDAEYSSINIDRDVAPVANEFAADNERTHQRTFGFESTDPEDQYFNFERVLHTRQDATDTGINYLGPRVVSIGGDQFAAGYYAEDLSHGDPHYQLDVYTANTFEINTNGSWSRGRMEDERGGRSASTFGDLIKVDDSNILTVATVAYDNLSTGGIIQFQVMQAYRGRPFAHDSTYILALDPQDRVELEGSGLTGKATEPRVVLLNDGGFAITWQEFNDANGDSDVYVQVFNDDYTVRTPVIGVDTAKGSDQTAPEITALKDGGFMIVWADSKGDGKGSGIEAQRYDENGIMQGQTFDVNSSTKGDQLNAAVTTLNNGKVVVTWDSEFGDGSDTSVMAQQLNVLGYGNKKAQDLTGTSQKEVFNVGAKNDTVDGGGGNDVIRGGKGNDKLYGSGGKDKLFGGAGNDRLDGGKGNDKMTGNGGADKFVFNLGKDTILDFQDDIDTVVFAHSLKPGMLTKARLENIVDESGSDLVFNFGKGNILTIKDVDTFDVLRDDISFIA